MNRVEKIAELERMIAAGEHANLHQNFRGQIARFSKMTDAEFVAHRAAFDAKMPAMKVAVKRMAKGMFR